MFSFSSADSGAEQEGQVKGRSERRTSLQIHEEEAKASVLASQFVLVEHNYSKSAMDVDISRDPESEGEVISVYI